MKEDLFSTDERVAYKGQIFSAPMDWKDIQQQLEDLESRDSFISLPVTGELLAKRVQVALGSGLVDLNKCIREATIRRPVVVRLIQMFRDKGHPDYQKQSMDDVRLRVAQLTPTDEPNIPMPLRLVSGTRKNYNKRWIVVIRLF